MRSRQPWFDLHDDSLEEPAVAVVGLPFDGSTSFRAGAAEAPDRLRQISRTSDAVTRRGRVVSNLTVRDFGDVSALDAAGKPLGRREYLDAAAVRLRELPAEAFTMVLGGDNSVSIPAVQTFAERHGPHSGIVWFDAHPDLFETYDDDPDSHACALRRAAALSGIPAQNVALVGVRSFSLEEAQYLAAEGIESITAAWWQAASSKDVVERLVGRLGDLPAVYLAVDIDGFDASVAPGTGYPMPGGIGSEEFFVFLEELVRRLPIRGMDVTEIAPPLDHNDRSSFLGVQVILEALGALSEARG